MPFISRLRSLQWSPAQRELGLLGVEAQTLEVPRAAPKTLEAMIAEMALPAVPPVARTAAEEATFLLQIASEVEHAFLLQYLYASYSLNRSLRNADVRTVADSFVSIAKQEMAHLVTVQNLLLALGKPLDFNREDFPAHPDLYPLPAALEPVSSDSIAKYVTAEAPVFDDIPPVDQPTASRAVAQAEQASHHAYDIHRVGAIYAVIYWLFQSGDQAEGPWSLSPAVIASLLAKYGAGFHIRDSDFADPAHIANLAAIPEEWNGDESMHIDPTYPRSSALVAVKNISFQGEGPSQGSEAPSHFDVLLAIYRDHLPNLPANAVLDVPSNPFVVANPSHPTAEPSEVSHPTTGNWCTLFNLRYRILLLDLVAGLSLNRAVNADLRNTLIMEWAVEFEMSFALSRIAKLLTGKPRTTDGKRPQFAGAPFTFGEALPNTACGLWKEQLLLLQRSASTITILLGTSSLTQNETNILTQIRTFDSGRRSQINQFIQQHCS